MKKAMRKAKLQEKRSIERGFLNDLRLALERQYERVRLVYFHSRRQRSKWICDGTTVYRDSLSYKSEDVPDAAWIIPEDTEPEFVEMFGVN